MSHEKEDEREIRQNQFLTVYVIQQGKRVGLSSVGGREKAVSG